jgi:hypothetical protein
VLWILELVLIAVVERLLGPVIDLASSLATSQALAPSAILLGSIGIVAIVAATILGVLLIQRAVKWLRAANEAMQKPLPLPKPSEKAELRVPFEYKVGSTSATISVSDNPLAPRTVTPEPRLPLVLTLIQFKYREEVRAELLRIHIPLYNVITRQPIQFKSWNELREPNFHTLKHDLIAIKEQDEVIESFSTALNRRNDNLWQPKFEELNDECISRYVDIRRTGFFDSDVAQNQPQNIIEAQLRLEPSVGFEKIPEPSRSEIIAPVIPQSGFMQSQQIYVKAINGDLTDCEVKLVVDGNGVDHMLWEGIRRQPPASAKEKLTIHRDDEKYFTLWYAQQKDGKEYLYIPITTSPHMPQYIGSERSPLVVDIWIIANGFSGKRHRFIIYRASWEGILAKEVGEDGISFAEFDALWHLSRDVQPFSTFGSQDMRGSDKASTLHISHRGKEISLNARMRGLKPSYQYQVEVGPSYTAGRPIQGDNIGSSRTIFMTDMNGEASWSFTLSADELTARGLTRFSVWVGDVPNRATVLLSDNISFHN